MTTNPSTQERAQQTAATAADETRKVADTAKGEAQNVAAEAKAQVSSLVDEATNQLSEQSRTQRDRLVGTLQTFGTDLEQMAAHGSGSSLATDLARQLADRSRSLSSHMDGREPAELLEDVRRFARRRPGTFILGALTAGVVAGRLARGAKAAKDAPAAPTEPTLTTAPVAAPPAPVSPVLSASPAPMPGTDGVPTYSAPGLATPQQPGSGNWTGTDARPDPLTDPLTDPLLEQTTGEPFPGRYQS